MIVRLKEPISVITPPLALILFAARRLYQTVGRLSGERENLLVVWENVKMVLEGTFSRSTWMIPEHGARECSIVCDAATNPPKLGEQRKVRVRVSIKDEPGPDFYSSDFTLSRTEAGVLDVEQRLANGVPAL